MTLHFAVLQIYLMKLEFSTVSPAENRRPSFLLKKSIFATPSACGADMRAVIEDIMSEIS